MSNTSPPSLEKGVYRHSKTGRLYEVIGVALETELDEWAVVYRPLYDSEYEFFVRPYEMFTETVDIDGKMKQRFEKHDT